MNQKGIASTFILATALVMSPILDAAEITIRATANVLDPVVVTSSFNSLSNTLTLETKGESSYSLDVMQSDSTIRIEVNKVTLQSNLGQQHLATEGELALTVNHSISSQNPEKPTLTLNYN